MAIEAGTSKQFRVGIYLAHHFPLAPLSLVLDALRISNLVEGKETFSHVLVSADGRSVVSSSELSAAAQQAAGDAMVLDVALVCAGDHSARSSDESPHVLAWLRDLYRRGVQVGGISSGAFILARAGLLDGRSCAVHWASVDALAETFDRVTVVPNIFCIDGGVVTCSGGMSTLDLMLHLLAGFKGERFARTVGDLMIYPDLRKSGVPARADLRQRLGVKSAAALGAVRIMEANIETPVPIGDIATRLRMPIRRLERAFLRAFNTTPTAYYLNLRLSEARALVTQTDRPILHVALRCGFSDASHFSRSYRRAFGCSPSEDRIQSRRAPGSTMANERRPENVQSTQQQAGM